MIWINNKSINLDKSTGCLLHDVTFKFNIRRRMEAKEALRMEAKNGKSKQQAELARQQGAVGGQTNIVDARQSSSVTTTGQTTGVIMPNKYGRLNMSDIGM